MTPGLNNLQTPTEPRKIRIAAAIIKNPAGQMLLVRKHGTSAFIQPGGKIEPAETPLDALKRELREELNCAPVHTKFCGQFSAPAVNEPGHLVEAILYHVEIDKPVIPAAEIAEILWIDPAQPGDRMIAPLTRDHIFPLARSVIL